VGAVVCGGNLKSFDNPSFDEIDCGGSTMSSHPRENKLAMALAFGPEHPSL